MYYDHLNDSLQVAAFEFMTKEGSQSYASRLATLASGPGRYVTWEETLSPLIRAELEKCRREAEETLARRKARAKLSPEEQPKKFGRKRKPAK